MALGYTWLYVVEHEHGYYKIGHSENPKSRASQLQVGSPYEIKLWLMAKFLNDDLVGGEPELEEQIHERFDSGHVRGEWFEADRDEIYQYLGKEAEAESAPVTRLVNYPRERQKKENMQKSRFGKYYGPLDW